MSADASDEQDTTEVAWGAAFFDFPAADGLLTPHSSTPATWRSQFIEQYKTVYGGLFRTCRTGRDWVLTTAPEAQLTLQLTPEQLTGGRWQRQLQIAQQALATRGQVLGSAGMSVIVDLSEDGSFMLHKIYPPEIAPAKQAAIDSLLSFLQTVGQYISATSSVPCIALSCQFCSAQRVGYAT